jgi:hypothetical protein
MEQKLRKKFLRAQCEYEEELLKRYQKEMTVRLREIGRPYYKYTQEKEKSVCSDELEKLFRKLSLIYHPDRPGGDAEIFKFLLTLKEDNDYQTLLEISEQKIVDIGIFMLEKRLKKIHNLLVWKWGQGSTNGEKESIESMFHEKEEPIGPPPCAFNIKINIPTTDIYSQALNAVLAERDRLLREQWRVQLEKERSEHL